MNVLFTIHVLGVVDVGLIKIRLHFLAFEVLKALSSKIIQNEGVGSKTYTGC